MAYRGITEKEVEFVLNNPCTKVPGEPGTSKITAYPDGRRIEIIVPDENPCKIITAACD
jgi:hypothetical protein